MTTPTRWMTTFALVALGSLAVACDRGATDADNTARNRGDGSAPAKTPMDQSNANKDLQITADIRKAIIDDISMSVNAQNCKIITDGAGVVTLRGAVDSQAEKDSIERKAKAVAGVSRVVNELEVKAG